MAQREMNKLHGVNVDQLVETIEHVKDKPDLAQCKFRAETEWINGAHTKTRIKSFYAAGQEDSSRAQPFILEGDEPPVLLGENRAPNAVETLLHALSSCLAVGFTYNAAAMGINVESLNFSLEGDLDLHAFLGISDKTRPGYKNINVSYQVKCDAPREKVEELCEYVQKTSPVLDMLRNPVPVNVSLQG